MSSADFHNLGLYLKEKRSNSGFTQVELSEALKVHVQFVSNWERGLCAPPNHCFEKLVQVLNLNRDTLVKVMVDDSKRLIELKVFSKRKKSNAG